MKNPFQFLLRHSTHACYYELNDFYTNDKRLRNCTRSKKVHTPNGMNCSWRALLQKSASNKVKVCARGSMDVSKLLIRMS